MNFDIVAQINAMRADITSDLLDGNQRSMDKYISKYNTLYQTSPYIFKTVFGGDPEQLAQLDFMINQSKKIDNNEISQHDADVVIGQKLVDKYVKPALDDKRFKEL